VLPADSARFALVGPAPVAARRCVSYGLLAPPRPPGSASRLRIRMAQAGLVAGVLCGHRSVPRRKSCSWFALLRVGDLGRRPGGGKRSAQRNAWLRGSRPGSDRFAARRCGPGPKDRRTPVGSRHSAGKPLAVAETMTLAALSVSRRGPSLPGTAGLHDHLHEHGPARQPQRHRWAGSACALPHAGARLIIIRRSGRRHARLCAPGPRWPDPSRPAVARAVSAGRAAPSRPGRPLQQLGILPTTGCGAHASPDRLTGRG
jgi:hypothetical protein